MPREKECYRENLMLIREAYPDKTMLTATEIAQFWGKDVRTVRKVLGKKLKKRVGVSITVLASEMS